MSNSSSLIISVIVILVALLMILVIYNLPKKEHAEKLPNNKVVSNKSDKLNPNDQPQNKDSLQEQKKINPRVNLSNQSINNSNLKPNNDLSSLNNKITLENNDKINLNSKSYTENIKQSTTNNTNIVNDNNNLNTNKNTYNVSHPFNQNINPIRQQPINNIQYNTSNVVNNVKTEQTKVQNTYAPPKPEDKVISILMETREGVYFKNKIFSLLIELGFNFENGFFVYKAVDKENPNKLTNVIYILNYFKPGKFSNHDLANENFKTSALRALIPKNILNNRDLVDSAISRISVLSSREFFYLKKEDGTIIKPHELFELKESLISDK